MRIRDIIMEVRTLQLDVAGRKDRIRAMLDPSASDIRAWCGNEPRGLTLRGMMLPADWAQRAVIWKAMDSIHLNVAKPMGIPAGDSSDEHRRNKIFVNGVDGEPQLCVHECQREDRWVQRMIDQGMVVKFFER